MTGQEAGWSLMILIAVFILGAYVGWEVRDNLIIEKGKRWEWK